MFEEFYQKYETQEQEVIALIRKCVGAGHHKGDSGDFWNMTAITLGMVFCNTGKVSIKEGRLEWPVTEEERNSEKSWGRLQQGQICRLKVRRLLDELVPEYTTPEQFNRWAVIEVLEPSVPLYLNMRKQRSRKRSTMNTAAVSGGSAKTMTSMLPMKRLSVRSTAAMTERLKISTNSYRMRKGLKSSSTKKG